VLQQECHFDSNSFIIIADLKMLKGQPVLKSHSCTTQHWLGLMLRGKVVALMGVRKKDCRQFEM
jgi:hypothetical protein